MEIKGMDSTMPGKYSGIKPPQASQKKKPSDDLMELLNEKQKALEFGAGSPVAKISESHQTGRFDSPANPDGGYISLDVKV